MKKLVNILVILQLLCLITMGISCAQPTIPTEVKYKIEYVSEGHGTAPSSIEVDANTELSKKHLEALPDAEGYYFESWLLDGKPISEGYKVTDNITLVASWKKYLIVSYNANGHGTAPAPITNVKVNDTLSEEQLKALPDAEGYYFESWLLDGKPVPQGYKVTDNITLVASWKKYLTVTYNENGRGTAPAPITNVKIGDTLSEEQLKALPDAEGYYLESWLLDGKPVPQGYKVTDNITLLANWKKYITVTYKANGHGTAPAPITNVKVGDTLKNIPQIECNEVLFRGWKIGDTELTTDYKFTQDVEAVAQWQLRPVTFKMKETEDFSSSSEMYLENPLKKATIKYNQFSTEPNCFYSNSIDSDILYDDVENRNGQVVAQATCDGYIPSEISRVGICEVIVNDDFISYYVLRGKPFKLTNRKTHASVFKGWSLDGKQLTTPTEPTKEITPNTKIMNLKTIQDAKTCSEISKYINQYENGEFPDQNIYVKFDTVEELNQVKTIIGQLQKHIKSLHMVCTSSNPFKIPENTFMKSDFSQINEVYLEGNINEIGTSAFDATTITRIIIYAPVQKIGDYAFYYSQQLNKIILPDSLTEIGAYAFQDTKLSKITLPNSIEKIGELAFENTRINEYTLPDNLTILPRLTSSSKYKINSITIPNKVTTIAGNALNYDFNNDATVISNIIFTDTESEWDVTFTDNNKGVFTPDKDPVKNCQYFTENNNKIRQLVKKTKQ